jgi:hypothetical protein
MRIQEAIKHTDPTDPEHWQELVIFVATFCSHWIFIHLNIKYEYVHETAPLTPVYPSRVRAGCGGRVRAAG